MINEWIWDTRKLAKRWPAPFVRNWKRTKGDCVKKSKLWTLADRINVYIKRCNREWWRGKRCVAKDGRHRSTDCRAGEGTQSGWWWGEWNGGTANRRCLFKWKININDNYMEIYVKTMKCKLCLAKTFGRNGVTTTKGRSAYKKAHMKWERENAQWTRNGAQRCSIYGPPNTANNVTIKFGLSVWWWDDMQI